ncbi:uncharacterized protein TNCV_2225261 [Trichonephila clavipes]|nr:uncharacterized protein TNCV_2225261 [Trichonephila clavipes]
MRLRQISELLRVIGWIWHIVGSSSMAATIPKSHTVGLFFSVGQFIKVLVYRDVVTTQTVLDARLHAACTSVNITLLRRLHASILRRAQDYLDLHDGRLDNMSFANTVVDVSYTVAHTRGSPGGPDSPPQSRRFF